MRQIGLVTFDFGPDPSRTVGTIGISAVVEPAGQIVQQLEMGKQGIIYAEFQPRSSTTPYVRFGDWFAWVAMAFVIIGMVRRQTA